MRRYLFFSFEEGGRRERRKGENLSLLPSRGGNSPSPFSLLSWKGRKERKERRRGGNPHFFSFFSIMRAKKRNGLEYSKDR